MYRSLPISFALVALLFASVGLASNAAAPQITAEAALAKLTEGNARFASGQSTNPEIDAGRRAETVDGGQHPFAAVVACSDSRVPVERLFDQGVGSIFVIRVAGNVCDTDEVGSVEYGVDHLGTPLLVVLGHTSCGAVTAVVTGAEVHGNIVPLVEKIKPAAVAAQKEHPDIHGNDLVASAIRDNVWQSIDDLMRTSPMTRKLVQAGKLKVVGAIYDLRSGKVEWMGAHPQEKRLLAYTDGPAHGAGDGHASARAGHATTAPATAMAHATTAPAVAHTQSHTPAQIKPVALLDKTKLSQLDEARHREPGKIAAVSAAEDTGVSLIWKVLIAFVGSALLAGVGLKSGMLRGMGIAGKLYAGFGLLVVLAVGMGYLGYHALAIVDVEDRCALSAFDLAMKSAEAGGQQNEWLLVGMENKTKGEELIKSHGSTVKAIHEEFATLRACDPDGVQAAVIQNIEQSATKYDKSFSEIVNKFHEVEVGAKELNNLGDGMEREFAAMVKSHEADIAELGKEGASAEQLQAGSELLAKLNECELLVAEIGRYELEFLLEKRIETISELEKRLGLLHSELEAVGELIPRASKDKAEEQADLGELAKVAKEVEEYQKVLGTVIEDELTIEADQIACHQDLQMLSTNARSFAEHLEIAAAQTKAETNELTIGMLAVVAALGAGLAFLIVRAITKPVNRIIRGLDEGSKQVEEAARQVSVASQQLAEGATEQASSLEETSAAMQEMAAMTRTNASSSKEADTLVGQVQSTVKDGTHTVDQLNEAMKAINDSSDKISKIIKVIEEIAFQTNLLALNAAVEAARAGEHGKGFAVVADEVRSLAQRAAQAAGETTELIQNAVDNARGGAQVANAVAKVLTSIQGDVGKASGLVQAITKASEEQAQGVEQINTAVAQMDKVTQINTASAEESAAASEEMAGQAQALKGMVDDLITLVRGGSAGANHAAALQAGATKAANPNRAANPPARSAGQSRARRASAGMENPETHPEIHAAREEGSEIEMF